MFLGSFGVFRLMRIIFLMLDEFILVMVIFLMKMDDVLLRLGIGILMVRLEIWVLLMLNV